MSKPCVCLVAIARDEDPFVEEWVAYHRILGVERFVIYDDDPSLPLANVLARHRQYVDIVPWYNVSETLPGRNRQTKAYWHSVTEQKLRTDWVGFLDIDEFVRLVTESSLPGYLDRFCDAEAVSLQWHVFGHNGYFDDPAGLIIETLTRRMASPSRQFKTFIRPQAIADIASAHSCLLKPGARHVDANGRPFANELYEGISAKAHINHYQCRSFLRWMRRVERGDVNVDNTSVRPDAWRVNADACLRHFVETVARDKNECVDTSMLQHVDTVRRLLQVRRSDQAQLATQL